MKIKKPNLQIAIDGPVGAGKSIGAYEVAKKLNIFYVNTGAMYRAVAWVGLKNGLDLKKEGPLIKLLKRTKIRLKKSSKRNIIYDVFVNGKNMTSQLFSSRVHWGSSQVSIFPKVRKFLVKLQQEIAENQSVIMEGRDIATIVLPNADLKIYMTADLNKRAKRRLKDLSERGEKVSLTAVIKEIKKRDYNDTHRKLDPLKIATNAWVLDTTNLTIKEEISLILKKLKNLGLIE